MTVTFDHETAKHFVRDTLGCQCPESVFDQIDYQENAEAIRPVAESVFAEIEDIDTKVHLHVLGNDEVGGLI